MGTFKDIRREESEKDEQKAPINYYIEKLSLKKTLLRYAIVFVIPLLIILIPFLFGYKPILFNYLDAIVIFIALAYYVYNFQRR